MLGMTNLVVFKYTRLTMLFSLLLFQLVKWLVDNLGQSQKKADMRKLYDEGKFRVTFQNYDWSVNK